MCVAIKIENAPAQVINLVWSLVLSLAKVVKSILFGVISSCADANSINNNVFFFSCLAKGMIFFVGLAARGL